MGRLIKTIVFLIVFWILSGVMVIMFKDFLDDYDLFDTEDTPAIVTEKVSVNNLTSMPKYYVLVDLNEPDGFMGVKNRVFPRQFKQLEVGDTLEGHHIHGDHFFTTLDVVKDSGVFIGVMILLLFFLFALIMWPVFVFLEKREKKRLNQLTFSDKEKLKKKRKQKKPDKNRKKVIMPFLKRVLPEKMVQPIENITFQQVLLMIFFSISVMLVAGFVMNGLFKFSPIGKTATTAFVTDSNATSEVSYYVGKYSDPYYTLDLNFSDKQGNEYQVIKEVTRSLYRKHGDGRPIEISYATANPYHVYVRDYSILNLFETMKYAKFIFLSAITIGIIIYLAVRRSSRKKRRKNIEK